MANISRSTRRSSRRSVQGLKDKNNDTKENTTVSAKKRSGSNSQVLGTPTSKPRQTKRGKISRDSECDKENDVSVVNTPPNLSGVTPYWKVAEERGYTSPPATRSAKKKRFKSSLDSNEELQGAKEENKNPSAMILTFSPPNLKAIKKREQHLENKRKERLEARRRTDGCVVYMSPLHHTKTKDAVKSTKIEDNNLDPHLVSKGADPPTSEDQKENDTELELNKIESPSIIKEETKVEPGIPSSPENSVSSDTIAAAKEYVANNKRLLNRICGVEDKVESELLQLRAVNKVLMQDKEQLQDEVKEIWAMNKMLSKEKGQMQDTIQRMELQKNDLEKSCEDLCDQLDKVKADGEVSGKNENKELTLQIRQIEAESLDEIRVLKKEKDDYAKTLMDAKAKLISSTEQLVELKNQYSSGIAEKEVELKGLQRALVGKKEQIHRLENQVAEKEIHQNELEMKYEKVAKELQDAKNMCDSQNISMVRDEETLKTKISILEKEIVGLNEKNNKVEEERGYYMAEINKKEQCLKQKHKSEMAEKDSELQASHTKYIAAKETVERLQIEIADMDHLQNELKSKLETVVEELRSSKESCNNQINSVKKDKEDLKMKILVLEKENQGLTEKNQKFEDENRSLHTLNNKKVSELENMLTIVTKRSEEKKFEVVTLKCEKDAYQEKMDQILDKKDQEIIRTNHLLGSAQQQLADTKSHCKELSERLKFYKTKQNDLVDRIRKQDEMRRCLHNKVMKLSGNIKVFVRVRPTLNTEINLKKNLVGSSKNNDECPFSFPGLNAAPDDPIQNLMLVKEPHKDRGGLNPRRKKWQYSFDNVFAPSHKQEDIWESVEPLVQSCLDGYNVCIFAYGQTGSGKTFTMLGTNDQPGIIYRSILKIFDAKKDIEERCKGNVNITVELLEIYNENVQDLLVKGRRSSISKGADVKVNANEAVGNAIIHVSCEEEVIQILNIAQQRRCIKATKSNEESSRSHLIFSLKYVHTSSDGIKRSGKLNICDLAGSERLSKSESIGSTLKETQHINKSLSSLSNVIEKLQAKSAHIPFRESKLTYLLQNSLEGDSKTLAVICCNPDSNHFNESMCSLRFASKVNKVEMKAAANFSC